MSPLRRPVAGCLVTVRRVLARRPWLYWLVVVAIAVGFGLSQRSRGEAIEAERASWGNTVDVLIAVGDHSPGDPIEAEVRSVPVAVAPEFAIIASDAASALGRSRQRIGPGEIITVDDIAPSSGPLGLAPDGWVVVPAEESTPSGVEIGDHVMIVSDGFPIADDAFVVGTHEDAILLAVARTDAAAVATAGETGVTFVRTP